MEQTALHAAAMTRHVNVVKYLVEKGAQVDAKNKVRIDMYKMWQILHSVAIFDPMQLVYHACLCISNKYGKKNQLGADYMEHFQPRGSIFNPIFNSALLTELKFQPCL